MTAAYSDGGGARSYSYNSRNRLAGISEGAVSVASYEYNALGQRVRKVTASEDTDFVYDLDGKLLGEYADGVLKREYVYLNGRPVAQIDASQEVLYLHYDHLGTPRSATDANRHVVWRWDSDPFGATEPDSDPDGDSTDHDVLLRFPGQYADEESGHYYNYSRDYQPSVARYTAPDPVGLKGGLNRFAYVGGAPLSWVDPLGTVRWDASIVTVGGGRIFGGAYFDMTFVSECIGGTSVSAHLMAVGFGVAFGAKGAAVSISSPFEDPFTEPNARNLDGVFRMMAAGATVSPVAEFMIGGPGVGMPYGWMQVGRAFATPGASVTLGADLSAMALRGWTWILSSSEHECGDCTL